MNATNIKLLRIVRKLDPSKFFIRSQSIQFLSVFVIYQIIDNVTVIESFIFNQAWTAGRLRESNIMRIVGRLFITN
ncbi:UNVERIFIED_CONTAM: hypothetical protein NCL1_42270 [Trichonephila clavipes]